MSDDEIPRILQVTDFLEFVASTEPNPRDPVLWFRGQGDYVWELQPAVLRKEFFELLLSDYRLHGRSPAVGEEEYCLGQEIEINRKFQQRSAFDVDPDTSLYQLYFLAQHHGLPTRLLDWTTNPLAALFFAMTSSGSTDGEVFAISPALIGNMKSASSLDAKFFVLEHGHFQDQRSKLVTNTIEVLFGLRRGDKVFESIEYRQSDMFPLVIGIVPETRTGRLFQQQSRFTLHMPGCEPLQKTSVSRCIIPGGENKELLLAELRRLGVRWDTLFPDLDHVALEIRSQLTTLSNRGVKHAGN